MRRLAVSAAVLAALVLAGVTRAAATADMITVSKTVTFAQQSGYSWSAATKSASVTTLDEAPGSPAQTVTYTVTAQRTTGVLTDAIGGTITVTNGTSSSVPVFIHDTVLNGVGIPRATATVRDPVGNELVGGATTLEPGTTTFTYTATWRDEGDSSLTNHVEVVSATPGAPSTVLASADATVPLPFRLINGSATVADTLVGGCPSGLDCGTPSPGVPVLTSTSGNTYSATFTRSIRNISLCGESGPTSAEVKDQATVQPSDNGAAPTSPTVTVSVNAPSCLPVTKGIGSKTNTRTYGYDVTKSADQAAVQILRGQSATLGYTITATRTVSSTNATISGDGSSAASGICITNNTGSAGTPTITDTVAPGGTAQSVAATSIANGATTCFAFSVSFTPSSDGTSYTNHVDVSLNGHSGSTDTGFTLPNQSATNPTATITDSVITCPSGMTCTPATGTFSFTESDSASRTYSTSIVVRNDTVCDSGTAAQVVNRASVGTHTSDATVTIGTGPCESPPTITGPGDITVNATSPAGAPVTFTLSATGGTPTCMNADGQAVASGDVFPVGTTTVTCTVTNGAGSASTTFHVTVIGVGAQLTNLMTGVHSLDVKLQHAIDELADGQPNVACNELNAFAHEAAAQVGHQLSAADYEVIVLALDRISHVIPCA